MLSRLRSLLICLSLIIWCTLVYAQSQASELYREAIQVHSRSDFKEAQEKFDSSRAIALESGELIVYFEASGMLLDCLHKNFEIRRLVVEVDSMRNDLNRYQDNISIGDHHRFNHVNRIFSSLAYVELGDSDSALDILFPMLDSLNALLPLSDSIIIYVHKFKILLYISEINLAQGNYEQTLYYANEAIILSESLPNADGWLLRPHYTRVTNYILTGRMAEANEELRSIVKLIPGLVERRTERTALAYLKISELQLKTRSLDSALYYLNLVNQFDNTGFYKQEVRILEGEVYYAGEEYEKSKLIYHGVRNALRERGAEQGELIANCHLQLGKIAMEQGRPDEALSLLHSALLNFTGQFDNTDPTSTPSLHTLYSRLMPVEIIYYKSKALFELYKSTGDKRFHSSSWETIVLGINFVDKLRTSYFDAEDKAFLIEQSYRIFEHALRICHDQLSSSNSASWVDTAFTLMERSKALNLMDAVKHENARRFAGIPESLLKAESTLRIDISVQEELIRQINLSEGADIDSLNNSTSQLGEMQRQYRQLIETIETKHPRYYQLRYGASKICLADIQSILDRDATVIEYFVAESEIYTLVIEKNRKQLLVNRNAKQTENLISRYRAAIRDCLEGAGNEANDSLYLKTAMALYDSLVRPVLPLQRSVVVVPDGALNYLSFAGLISENPKQYYDFRDQPYMLWDHEISYCYSMSLYRELQQKQDSEAENSVIFAPEFGASSTSETLTYNAFEAQHVAKQTNGQALVGKQCTASAVREKLESSSGYRIVHFATHGVADIAHGTDSYLQFTGPRESNRLYARELYNYSLDANLVYLSACETGGGELLRGEGIISIARAFFYAGTRSLVTALWSIGDERARDLTIGFYDKLMSGKPIDRSVAHAQRQYLRAIPTQERYLAHPAYWSALVPIGSSSAVVQRYDVLWIALLAGSMILFFSIRKILKKDPTEG